MSISYGWWISWNLSIQSILSLDVNLMLIVLNQVPLLKSKWFYWPEGGIVTQCLYRKDAGMESVASLAL